MMAYCDDEQLATVPPVDTQHDQNVGLILHHFRKTIICGDMAYDLGSALCLLQESANGKRSEVLSKVDRDELMKAAGAARHAAELRLGSQCLFREIEEGMAAVSEQIFLWSLDASQRAAYTSAFRLRMGRNIRTLRNILHNIDNRLQNAKADHGEQKARDAEIIKGTIISLRMIGINLT